MRVFQRAELLQEMHHQPAEAGLGELHADNGVLAYCGANSLWSNPQSVYCDRSRKLSFPLFSLKGKKKNPDTVPDGPLCRSWSGRNSSMSRIKIKLFIFFNSRKQKYI